MRNFLPVFLCRLIGHRRSARLAYIDPVQHRWRSRCRRCGTRLWKDGLLGWQEELD